ncbi:bifunctional metallophosphatase/5'-nucleotidase [Halosimplex salinum]|uniref:bifunctional metallophosphatase/5'-nucleotidase n=1 Tax=Halosimplex salinum TaxID=1710538 RepID=UPI000F4A8F35|nr:bifunctional metallophosphatase/5'-nucleotidase [Halosimplex salinum]
MVPRLLHYSDIENAHDRPERMGRLAGTIDDRRDERTLVVGTGDDTAPGALGIETRGHHSLAFFERVEPDIETFGNHDFDYGLRNTREIVAESPVTWVSANVGRDGDPVTGVDPAVVVERDGHRVGVIGVSGRGIHLAPALTVGDPVAAVRRVAADRDLDSLVVLAHASDETVREIARETAANAVLAGHCHDVLRERVDGTLLVRPGSNGEVVWEVTLGGEADVAEDGEATATRHDVTHGPIDETMADRVRANLRETGLDKVVATVESPVERDRRACLRGEARLANFATDALRWVADADVAHVDTRGLRGGPPIGPDVRVVDLVGVSPFEAGVFVATVSGRELRQLVAESHRSDLDTLDGHAWTGQFSGIEIQWDPDAGETEVSFDGSPLEPDRELRLATNGYVVYTDEFQTLGPADARELHGLQYRAFVDYARGVSDLSVELDGRIEDIAD